MWLSGGCGQLLRFLECDCAEQPAIVSCLWDLVLPRFGTAHHGKSLPGLAATTEHLDNLVLPPNVITGSLYYGGYLYCSAHPRSSLSLKSVALA
ncbi:Olfactory receptor [Trichinella spiralis]|uniref:Olfactory receptor n=2 Tax=Trichinella spiralis TaxID=6334 RepID=A0ABR3L1V8_TRISP|nr:hypothetical protein T01_4963 [Trichinella spiralis]